MTCDLNPKKKKSGKKEKNLEKATTPIVEKVGKNAKSWPSIFR